MPQVALNKGILASNSSTGNTIVQRLRHSNQQSCNAAKDGTIGHTNAKRPAHDKTLGSRPGSSKIITPKKVTDK